MLFNSIQFLIFFTIVYGLYLMMDHRRQNRMLLVASYIFYGSWDWRFLSLIVISTVVDYYCGIKIHETKDIFRRKFFLFISILANLSILGFFKYFNFFAENLQALTGVVGLELDPVFLRIILPIGISFYTFQTMSYTIDIYGGKLKPTKKFLDFALFVAFFPQLVAGPIERAKHLLPQILSKRKVTLDSFYEGCYLIFWGIFLKVFVADNLAKLVDPVFDGGAPYNGMKVLIALYAFAFQIFGDFAGYSNIARGLGKCMGFDIMINFRLPYFATNPVEFWHRWHISLSSWLRDYLYIPLGGNRRGIVITYRNLAIAMLLGGLWHGAAWTFIIWGAYQGGLLIFYKMLQPYLAKIPVPKSDIFNKIWFVIRLIFFFQLICLGWLIFRAQSLTQLAEMFRSLFFNMKFIQGLYLGNSLLKLVFFAGILFVIQIYQYVANDLMIIYKSNRLVKTAVYTMLFLLLTIYGVTSGNEFIYFQF